ncbi:MAG: tetratricopeptide repeat protein [Pirellulaceae bacterium]
MTRRLMNGRAEDAERTWRPENWTSFEVGGRAPVWVAAMFSLALIVGCEEPAATSTPTTTAQVTEQEGPDPTESFDRAADFLQRMDEFEPEQIDGQIIYHLNRWVDASDLKVDWEPDPLIEDLPAEFREHSSLSEIRDPKFQITDFEALKEALWMRKASNWIATNDEQPSLVVWDESTTEALGHENVRLLQEATRLFDWTIRNVQLDEMLNEPTGPVAGAEGTAERSDVSPARRAMPGPGYTAEPWQVMLYGHGDFWQRSRVFIQLARQQGLDVVMLGVPKSEGSKKTEPWLPALLLGEHLYLFDAKLGTPLPGPDGKGIATLAEVRANTNLLKSLSVGDAHPYRVGAGDLQHVTALIDASPEYLAGRMVKLQQRLTGKNQLVLSVSPRELAKRLRGIEGVDRVALWTLPIEADMFRSTVKRLLANDENFRGMFLQQFGLFEGRHPLVQARQKYFGGEFDDVDEKLGATGLYMECRLPDELIRDLATNPAAQKRMGFEQGNLKPEIFQRQMQGAQMIALQAKTNATYWIGFVHFANGNYKVASDWFQRSAEQHEGQGPWAAGAKYNLARSYEALGRWEDARKIYLLSESPQQHGDLVRARLIAQQHP